jgi:hypothetical protein
LLMPKWCLGASASASAFSETTLEFYLVFDSTTAPILFV